MQKVKDPITQLALLNRLGVGCRDDTVAFANCIGYLA